MKRIVLTIGYYSFLMPPGSDAGVLLGALANARPIDRSYAGRTSQWKAGETKDLEIKLVDEEEIIFPEKADTKDVVIDDLQKLYTNAVSAKLLADKKVETINKKIEQLGLAHLFEEPKPDNPTPTDSL